MSGPWEKYQTKESGPWEKYGSAKPEKQPEPDYNPTSGMTGFERGAAGAGKAVADGFMGVGQALREQPMAFLGPVGGALQQVINAATPQRPTLSGLITGQTSAPSPIADFLGLPTAQDAAEVKARDKALMDTTGGTVGNIAGNVAMLLPTSRIPGAGTYTGAAGIGAVTGALRPVAPDESRVQNAAIEGAGGAAGTAVSRGVARVAQPIMQSPAVQKLLSEGVVPTPGQAAGGLFKRIENSIESLPIVGQIIKSAKERGASELNAAALRRSVPSGTQQELTAIGRRGLEQADEILSRGYERVVPNISIKATNDFRRALTEAGMDEGRFLTEQGEKELARVIESRVFNRIPQGGDMPGALVQRIDSELGQIAREYSKSTDAAQRAFAGAVRDVQKELRTYISSQAKGAAASELKELNLAFANLVRVEKASGYTGAKDGVFSAAQLQQAVRAADNPRSFARGNALMQDLSDPAKTVLQDTVPDSGTAGRLLTAAGVTGAGVDAIFGSPGYLTTLAASPVIYSRPGARYMLGDLIPGQAAAANFLRSTAPYTGVLGMGISGQQGR